MSKGISVVFRKSIESFRNFQNFLDWGIYNDRRKCLEKFPDFSYLFLVFLVQPSRSHEGAPNSAFGLRFQVQARMIKILSSTHSRPFFDSQCLYSCNEMTLSSQARLKLGKFLCCNWLNKTGVTLKVF